jgi:hypothetical protein
LLRRVEENPRGWRSNGFGANAADNVEAGRLATLYGQIGIG